MTDKNLLNEIVKITKRSGKQTAKQKKVVEAAINLFAEKGYSNTSTSEIAKQAEVSEGIIFKHYGTKDNLLLSIIVPYIKDFFPSMADEVLGKVMNNANSFEQFLKIFLKNRINFIVENRDIFRVLIKEMIYREELKNELLPYLMETISTRMGKIIDHFKQKGELIEMPSESILQMLATFISGFFISRFVILNRQSIHEDEINEIINFVLNGIRK